MKKRSPLVDTTSLRWIKEHRETLRSVESFPYSEELSSVMVSPVYTCGPGESVTRAAREMARQKISSVVVVGEEGEPLGILTEGDVLRRIVASGREDASSVKVSEIMSPNPATLGPGDTIYRALSVLASLGVKHLPLAEEGRVVGMVTLRQMLRLRHPEPTLLIGRVQEARSPADLGALLGEMAGVASAKLAAGIGAFDVSVMLSLINRDIHRRAFEMSVERAGELPAEVCLFVTGSHGRMENLLSTDQDHGMIIAEGGEEHEAYFIELARTFSEMLLEIGYAWCPGYVMSANPTWRKTVPEWKRQISYWFERQMPGLARYVTVFFDAAPILGSEALFHEVDGFARGLLAEHYEVLRLLHEEEGSHRVPTGLLGRFITEREGEHKGELDIKRSGLIFVVEAVRILALMRGMGETSTLKRIAALVEGGRMHPDDGEYYEAAFKSLLHFALRAEVEKALAGAEPDTYVRPSGLSPREKELLRHAYRAVSSLQELVAQEFGELVI
ncbi:MAG: putative nucleotidyltransferase substrate binding domain-containing protein [Nitrospirota bacterium]|jgi:CBS domain-containing protein